MIDAKQQISSVSRRLGDRTIEAGKARVLTISQVYKNDIEQVWDACTNAERIPRWFLPVSGELRLGGRYQLEGNAGGTIERCDPPRSFAATWEMGGQVSWIELRLTSEPGGGTRFELEHTAHVDDHWDQYGPGAVGIGWDLGLLGLWLHLSSLAAGGDGAVDQPAVQAWVASPAGREYMELSSASWTEADIASGTDPADAKARAGRTIAAYTGEGQAGEG